MTLAAFALSEQIGSRCFYAPTTRCAIRAPRWRWRITGRRSRRRDFVKDPKWVIFPPLAYRAHVEIEALQQRLAGELSDSPFNRVSGAGRVGVAAGGVSRTYVTELAARFNLPVKILEVGIPEPISGKIRRGVFARARQGYRVRGA